jgi:RecB family exonuclease
MNHSTFIQRIAEHIQNYYDLRVQELTVVFPNKRAAFYLRNILKNNIQQTIWLPQMLSIQEAVTQWSGMTLVDNIDLLFELIDIDAELHKEQNSELSVFGSQAAQMAKDFDEIDQYDTDAQHLFRYVVENKKLEIWNFDETQSKEKELKYLQFFTSLYDYYVRLRERLLAKNQGYYGLITRQLAHLSDEELADRVGERKVIFAGFNALTTTETLIINKLVKSGKAEILFDYDRYYIDDLNNEAGLFARRYLAAHPDWLKSGITDRLCQEEKHIHIISASGNTLQAKALQDKLHETDNNSQAVILADEGLLIPVLNAIPDTDTYQDFKVSMGYPVKKTPINQLVTNYFSLQRRSKLKRRITEKGVERTVEGWYLWPVLQVMDTEIVKTIFTKTELSVFDHWKTESVSRGKFIFELQDIEFLQDAKDIQTFLHLLLEDDTTKGPTNVLQQISSLLQFVANKIQSRPDKSGLLFLLNQVSVVGQSINRIMQIVERHNGYVRNISDIEILFKLLSTNTSIKLNSSSTEGLQIMGLLETRNIDFERLHVLSVNEGILPTDKSQGSFIPYYIKKECGLPGYTEKQAVFAYHFYRLLQNGKDIYLYYNNLGELSGGEASRFILQIKHELSHCNNIHIDEESFRSDTQSSDEVFPITALKSNVLERLQHLVFEKGLSPSGLSTYLNCPLKYYLKYIEDIKDNSLEEEVGSNVVGTITHETLQLLFEPYKPQESKLQVIDKELFEKRIKPQWESMLAKAIEDNLPSGFPDVGFNYLNKITIRKQLESYLWYTSKQLKDNTLSIIALESPLEAKLETPFGEARFSGITDRIDRMGGITRVIDYKTGHVEPSDVKIPVRQETDTDLDFLKQLPEKAVQLLLYKYMYLKKNQNMVPSQVTAAIHGLRYGNTIEFALCHTTPKKGDTSVPFLEDDTFIADMETMLRAVVAEIFDTETPFVQTDDDKQCKNCDFKGICRR